MASISYLVFSPTAIACIIGLLRGPDKTKNTPAEDYRNATIDLVIPAHNEQQNIVLTLQSILMQTVKPSNIFVVDDGSTDSTSEYAKKFAKSFDLPIQLIRKETSQGKTQAISQVAHASQADVLFVLDADTLLQSENYIETLIKQLYQGIGNSSACGVVMPQTDKDRKKLLDTVTVKNFVEQYPNISKSRNVGWLQNFQQKMTNNYREQMYIFLQKFIYYGEMVSFGTLINPVGCAVAYRRKYLVDILDYYEKKIGYNLTTSEDIFIGFAFADRGYRNVQAQDVYALTNEPRVRDLPHQVMLWSSSFLQSCFYFSHLVLTPFKYPRYLYHRHKIKKAFKEKEITEKRVIKEAYRQPFGEAISKKYGRPIGWFIFTSLFEKITFPIIIVLMLLFNLWVPLLLTIAAEVLIYSFLIALMHKPRRFENFFYSILSAPLRYFVLLFDLVVIGNFAKDLITRNRKWKK